MKAYNTRFNPTCNGPLHLGHIYIAKVNEYYAHAHGGEFIVRFDDNQRYWNNFKGVDSRSVREEMVDDLRWLGLNVDTFISEAGIEYPTDEKLKALDPCSHALPMPDVFFSDEVPELISSAAAYYPYSPWLTARKVVMDFEEHIRLLIRGEDLVSEYALYSYFAQTLGLPNPRHVYLPRLLMADGNEITDISKTAGNLSVREIRKRNQFSADHVWAQLEAVCLIQPETHAWEFENLQRQPVWNP